ncbi:hypothetical protein KTH_53890 [Thermosporothrix hazakensis]|nr:hypothetical protein KTH_53890 [Thermosporothrix hazakensis]
MNIYAGWGTFLRGVKAYGAMHHGPSVHQSVVFSVRRAAQKCLSMRTSIMPVVWCSTVSTMPLSVT